MRKNRLLLVFLAIFIAQNANAQNCHPNLYTGWQYISGPNANLKLFMNIGCAVELEGFAFNDVTVSGNFNNCIQIDRSKVMYKGIEYTQTQYPDLFIGFNPSIDWATVGFSATYQFNNKTIRISEPVVYSGHSFSNLVSFWTMEEMEQWKRNNPNFTVKRSDFSFSNFKVGDITFENCSDIISKIQALESQKQKKTKLDELYKNATTDYNSSQLDAAMQKVREGLSIINTYNIQDPRFDDLKKKIEDKIANDKKKDISNKLDDLYNKASKAADANDKNGAMGYINEAEQIIKNEQLTDTRFADLRKKLDQASANSTNKTSSADTAKTSEDAAKKSESNSSSSDQNSSMSQDAPPSQPEGPTQAEIEAQQERERLNRMNDYYNERNAAISQNTELAASSATQLLLIYYGLGTLIYDNLDKQPGNIISAPGSAFEMQLGYSISSYPMFINVTDEVYDGYNYTYDNYSEVRNPFSLNMNLITNVWFLRARNLGFAATAHGTLGQGLYFQNFQSALNGGLKAYAGIKGLQFCGEYLMGARNFRYNDWIDAKKVQKGRSQLKYHQLKAGIRYTTETEWNGTTLLNIEFMPMFEAYRGVNYLTNGSFPMGVTWKKGIEMSLKFDNRMSFILQVSEQYPHKGKDLYGFKTYPKWYSTGFSLSVLRNIEFYDNQLPLMSKSNINYYLSSLTGDEIRFLSPAVEYLTPSSKLTNARPSIQSIKAFEYRHNEEISESATVGIGGNLGYSTLVFQNKSNSNISFLSPETENTISSVYISVPAEIKLYMPTDYNVRRWMSVGATYRKNLYTMYTYRAASSDASKANFATKLPVTTDGLFWTASIGMDYVVGNSVMTCGLQYKRSLKLLTSEDKTRLQGLELVFGVKI